MFRCVGQAKNQETAVINYRSFFHERLSCEKPSAFSIKLKITSLTTQSSLLISEKVQEV